MTMSVMKDRVLKVALVVLGLLWPLLAVARDLRPDLDRQWPLVLANREAAIVQVELTAPVYAAMARADGSDVLVLDADGVQVPATLRSTHLAAAPAQWQRLPWFALPASGNRPASDDLSVLAQRDGQGRITAVQTRVSSRTTAAASGSWLVDASALPAGMRVIRFNRGADAPALQLAVRVEGSDDLRQWRVLQPHAELIAVQQGGQQLEQLQLELSGGARYLRLHPLPGSSLQGMDGIDALLPERQGVPADLQWRRLSAQADTEGGWQFSLDGRYPVSAAQVAVKGNSAVRWVLSSREDASQTWKRRTTPWLAYQLGAGEQAAAQLLSVPSRDRQWLLQAQSSVVGDAPQLLLGYRPEQVVYLQQGRAPHALAAGSVRVQRAAAPVADTVQAMRQTRGAAWQPDTAQLGTEQVLAGADALRARRDWRTGLLWVVLLCGALLVGGLGVSLLRNQRSNQAS